MHAFWGPPLLNASDLPQAKCYLRKEPANAEDSAGNKKSQRLFSALEQFSQGGQRQKRNQAENSQTHLFQYPPSS